MKFSFALAGAILSLVLGGCGGSTSTGSTPPVPKNYLVTDLGVIGDPQNLFTGTSAAAVNNRGEVVGQYQNRKARARFFTAMAC